MLAHLAGELWPRVAGRELPAPGDLGGLDAFVPDTGLAGAIAPHASRAALELAILDCGCAAPDARSPRCCRRGGPG